ncbi:hypothetical protein GCM10023331_24730 [Algivirga pacifica]|uniref:MurNAc-LAA domain-containing protein n=2 Tax=Algivirga pacifica TaxID=1162670 RepID=A0ABP9DBD8_9BACT
MLLIGVCFAPIFASAQVPANVPQLLAGKRIAIDPGHGGRDSDDRQTPLGNGFTYWESAGCWEVGNMVNDLLIELGATTKMTRTTDSATSAVRDPSLSERVATANAFGADYMHSIHTNAANGVANYSLLLYRGVNGNPTWSAAKTMGGIMSKLFYEHWYSTTYYNRADRDFLPYHLGVLAGTNMPATLSEGAFHDVQAEGRRMMNAGYSKAGAWAIVKAFLQYFNAGTLSYGEVGGVIKDESGVPVNGMTVTLDEGTADEKVVVTDNVDNGFYFFDWLTPGTHTLKFEKNGFTTTTQNVTVSAGVFNRTNPTVTSLGTPPNRPTLYFVGNPTGGSSLQARWSQNGEGNLVGYRLYYAENDNIDSWKLAADENTLTATTTSVTLGSDASFVDAPTGAAYHFMIKAVAQGDGVLLESDASDIYSRSSGSTGDQILIVDGFDRYTGSASYKNPTHSFGTSYFKAIRDSYNAVVSTADNAQVADGTVDLDNYAAVVWFVGDESTVAETFAAIEQTKVKEYLEAGGKLLVSGSEIGWDLFSQGSTDDKAFYNNYLKANFVDDGSASYTPAAGVAGTSFDGALLNFGATYPEDYPDAISSNGGQNILAYNGGKTAATAYTGTFGSGSATGAVIYVSFPLETASLAEQTDFMGKALNYLSIQTVNVAPVANDDATATDEGIAVTIDVLSNDVDSNIDASTLAIVSAPANGTATVGAGNITYTPAAGFTGDATFTYQVSDAEGLVSNTATVTVSVFAPQNCVEAGPEVSPNHPKREFRGAWISTVANIDWPSAPGLSGTTQKAQLISILDDLQASGINAVLLQVRPESDALYASTIDPWSYYLSGTQGVAPSPYYDPLQFAIDEAHKRGMELHAWLNPYRAQQGTPTLAASHVANQHPDWVMDFSARDILNPGIPGVRDYVVDVVEDIVSRYDVDGIHFDDYFYPYEGMTDTKDASAFASYNPNNLSRADWRRDNVNQLISMVYAKIQEVNTAQNKGIVFGVSPFGIWKSGVPSGISGMSAYDVIYADALAWLQAGDIDYLTPQLYWDFGGAQDYTALSTWWDNQVAASGKHHYPGLGLYRLESTSSWSASTIQNMIIENRKSANEVTLGQVFFTTNDLTGNQKGVKDALSANEYKYQSINPTMGWLDGTCPLAPTNFRLENNTLKWDAPAAASDGDVAERYIVYRFSVEPNTSANRHDGTKIVAVTGETEIGLSSAWLTGTDNYFGVAAVDDNANESPFANGSVYVQAAPQYCAAQGNNSTYEWIAEVKVGSISKTSANDGGYADKTAESFTLTIGNSYGLTLKPGYSSTAYNENWKVWIDFNQDGDFEDAGEEVYAIPAVAKNTVTGTLSIPAGVSAGTTRMRVGMNGSSSDYTLNPCGSFAYGEVEDYTVVLEEAVAVAPSAEDDNAVTDTDIAVAIDVLANDTDPNGDINASTVTIVSAPSNGTATVNATTGVVTYTPAAGYYGSDVFTYEVSDDEGLVSNVATVSVTVNNEPPAPCAAQGNNSTYEWLQTVTIGAFSHTSGNDGGYGDHTDQTVYVTTGESYNVALLPGFSGSSYQEHWKIWIDFNADGDFEDQGELLLDGYGTGTAAYTSSIQIPFGVTGGVKTMRIGMNGTSADYTLNSCGSFNYGEVEDYYVNVSNNGCVPPTATSVVIDNDQAALVGTWPASTYEADYVGANYYYDNLENKGSKTVTYTPTIEVAGTYEVFVSHPDNPNYATNVPFDVNHLGGTSETLINQSTGGGTWKSLGQYEFAAGTSGNVVLRTTGTDASKYVIADAVRFDFVNCTVSGARTATDLKGLTANELTVYPNPAINYTNIAFRLNTDEQVNISVYNLVGKVVEEHVANYRAGNNEYQLNTSKYRSGMYVIKLTTNSGLELNTNLLKR